MPHDSPGRRSRIRPEPTGKSVALRPSDLVWFQKLHEHGPLPSSYLLAFTKSQRRNRKRSLERLTDLFNEDRTKHDGRYLDRPPQQFRTLDSRYNQLVHDLAPAGHRALAAAGRLSDGVPNPSGPWLHRLMVACTTASVELTTLDRPDLTFIPAHQILTRAATELRYPVPIMDPASGSRFTKDLLPDALFGLQYHTATGDRFRFFAVECDRATEPATSANWNRKSWRRSLLQYQSYVGGRRYRVHLQLTAPLLVLNVTTDPKRQAKMVAVTEEAAGKLAYLLFQTWPAFGRVWRPPIPRTDLLAGNWQRAGQTPFLIDRP